MVEKLWVLIIIAGVLCFLLLCRTDGNGRGNYSPLAVLLDHRFFQDFSVLIPRKWSAAIALSTIKITRLNDGERLTFLLSMSPIALIFAPYLQGCVDLAFHCATTDGMSHSDVSACVNGVDT